MLVKFYFRPVKTGTGEDGLPLYEDQVWVKINRDMTHSVDRQAKEEDFSRFRELYDSFKRETADYSELEGFPLEMWSALRPAEVANLKSRNFRTVQDLAKTKGTVLQSMPGDYKELVARSKKFIALAGMGTGLTKEAERISSENELLKEDLAAAKKHIKALEAKMEDA